MTWSRQLLSPRGGASSSTSTMLPDEYQPKHSYNYDLIVIGGGSGGMAAAKEAAKLGAKVACLDYVKPSPAGTSWGLGGTCVNVGCIPKKLYHSAALLHEGIVHDSTVMGIGVGQNADATADSDHPLKTTVQWPVLRSNIHNYIRSLNFKYRVALRDGNVEYFNKLAKFKDAHTITATDKKGETTEMTAARFLIAVGGRPTPLECEGGELAVSSDDIFFQEKPPGKTLCVGASYISLECAGFLAGLGFDVTVAVRSILLRGFDRECADRLGTVLEEMVDMKKGITPTKLEKVDNDQRIQVTFSDGSSDIYDTVLAAIGRRADTDKLGLEAVGVQVNPKNWRISDCKNEQSVNCPNVYAVGDVVDVRYIISCRFVRRLLVCTLTVSRVFFLSFVQPYRALRNSLL